MPTTKKLDALKINKLTEAQLATATVSEDELYLVTDAENPVTIKTDSTLSGDGSVANPLSVSPEVVKSEFGISKAAFKRAVGRLLKEGKIAIEDDGITIK